MFNKLNHLIDTFERDVQLARSLESSNSDDNLAVKAAIVGFSYNSPIAEWDLGHFEFLNRRFQRDYRPEQLAGYGENCENVKLFFALCTGYLLGVHQQDGITLEDFKVAEQQIPGVIMLHLGRITARSV